MAPKCFSATNFLRVFTRRNPASNDARRCQKFSQGRFAGVCDHETLSGSVSITGFDCRIERARAADQCLHTSPTSRKSSVKRLLNQHSSCKLRTKVSGLSASARKMRSGIADWTHGADAGKVGPASINGAACFLTCSATEHPNYALSAPRTFSQEVAGSFVL
jgi:hypothetical protein